MSFLKTVADDEATGELVDIYRQHHETGGYVPDSTRVLTTRPEVLLAYRAFLKTIQGGFSLPARDWRLITFIAARQIRSTYCSLAYAKNLTADFGSMDAVLAIQRDYRHAGLSPRDVEMLTYAEKITVAASAVSEDDIARLRTHGFTDIQISDIALCASWRNFISRFFDAVGATPDDEYLHFEQSARETLSVGRPFP